MDKEVPTLLDAAHALIEGVPRLARLMRQDLRRHSAGLFTEPQFRVMAVLYREGEQCFSGLADYQGVSLPTMSKLIQGLEARDLVGRMRDPEDRRRVLLSLTEEGVKAYESLLRRTETHIVDWIQEMTPQQRAELVRSFETVLAMFEKVDLDAFYERHHCGQEAVE
ncbi:MAG: MarR family winged helix-turn-helix transcriptional regulator [Anaerolineae bacterium]